MLRASRRLALLAALLVAACPAIAARLQVEVRSGSGPAANAAVMLVSPQAQAAVKPGDASIDQRNTQFVPMMSIIDVGTVVRFPNSDNVRHQVYSFSPAKRFQLPLYSGKQAEPVTFDVPGIVVLGCNIHDSMIAYVVVADTPYHVLTDAQGRAILDAPPGKYTLRVWHPDMAAGTAPLETSVEIGSGVQSRSVTLPLTARAPPPQGKDDKIRALQDKLKALKRGE